MARTTHSWDLLFGYGQRNVGDSMKNKTPKELRMDIHKTEKSIEQMRSMFDETGDMSWFYQSQELITEMDRYRGHLGDIS